MKCPRCQHDNAAAQKFCGECGTALSAACVACGASSPPGQKFCGQCGARLDAASTASKFASPQAYTPRHLAERILLSKEALEGERKQVTVLFADMKGSMELLADRDPEEARKLLDPVLERMMEAVHHYEGTVNQVMGDGIMALFGAPLAVEDHAVRACYAALRMQEQVSRYGDEMQRKHGVPIQLRVGLNSGEVVVRAIGSDLNMDYTAVGQTTHLAARMEQMAKPGTALITGSTLKLVEGYVQVRSLGPVSVKGLGEAIEVFELTGASAARTRLQAAVARGLTRFVGRTRELEILVEALNSAARGKGQVVAIVGEPGVGKSRLFYEFTRSHRTQGWLLVEAGSVSYGKATPYLPVIDLLKGYFRIGDRDDTRSIREKVIGKLLTLDRALEPLLSPLLALLDQPVEDAQWQRVDPQQRRRQTLDALKRLWLREAQAQPLILMFEDLHWIDSETQEFLDALLESVPAAHLLLLFNYRPEYQHAWGGKTYYTQLRLDPLSSESAEDLLRSLLGSDPHVQSLKQMLIERTEGNPFFLEESVRSLVESGALSGDRGGYRLLRPLENTEVPATVQAILAARIDRLASEDKRLLQTAAVIGKDVPYALLQVIAELLETRLREGLARLQAAEFLYEASLFPDLEYTFKHALTHEVTYGSLLSERRSALHRRILEAMEHLYVDRLTEHIDRLAHHAFRGEMWRQAVTYSQDAGLRALRRFAAREALASMERALSALAHMPETHENLERAIDIRLLARQPIVQLNEHRRLHAVMSESEVLARKLGDPLRLGWALTAMCQASANTGRMSEALEYGTQATAIAEKLGNAGLGVGSNFFFGIAFMFVGRYREATPILDRCISAGEQIESDDSAAGQPHLTHLPIGLFGPYLHAFADAYAAWCLTELGEFDQAIARGKRALIKSDTLQMSYAIGIAQAFLGVAYLRRGDFDRAIPALEAGFHLARNADVPFVMMLCGARLGYANAMIGRTAQAISLLESARELGEPAGERTWTPLTCVYLGEAYGLAGRHQEALTAVQHGIELARAAGERGYEAWGLQALAGIHAHCEPDSFREAEQSYRSALTLAQELEMRPLQAQCLMGLGMLAEKTGNKATARERLTGAATLFSEMGMQFWLDQTQVALDKFAAG